MSTQRDETGIAPVEDFPEDFPEGDFPEGPPDEFDGDALLEDEFGPDAQEDEFGLMLVELAGAICSQRPKEIQDKCYANFQSLQSKIPDVAYSLGVSLEDTKSALALCAPCMMKDADLKAQACPLQPLLETYNNETTCGEFIAQLFPDLN